MFTAVLFIVASIQKHINHPSIIEQINQSIVVSLYNGQLYSHYKISPIHNLVHEFILHKVDIQKPSIMFESMHMKSKTGKLIRGGQKSGYHWEGIDKKGIFMRVHYFRLKKIYIVILVILTQVQINIQFYWHN